MEEVDGEVLEVSVDVVGSIVLVTKVCSVTGRKEDLAAKTPLLGAGGWLGKSTGSATGVTLEAMAGGSDEYAAHNIINKDGFNCFHDGESNRNIILFGGPG